MTAPVDRKYLSDMTDRGGDWATLEVSRVQALLDERDDLQRRLNEKRELAREYRGIVE